MKKRFSFRFEEQAMENGGNDKCLRQEIIIAYGQLFQPITLFWWAKLE